MFRSTKDLNNKNNKGKLYPIQNKNSFLPFALDRVSEKESIDNYPIFRKFKSHEIDEKKIQVNVQSISEFEKKQFIIKKNSNSDLIDKEDENLKENKKLIFKIDIIRISKELLQEKNNNLFEIYFKVEKENINEKSERIKRESINKEKVYYKIATPKKEKRIEEEKEEIDRLDQGKIYRDLKKIINFEEKSETTYENTKTNEEKSASLKNNSFGDSFDDI